MEQQEASKDAVMTRIGQAVMLLHGGDREEARDRFGILWAEIGEAGDALHRCTLAHYMADAQDDPEDELAWDLRALAAAEGLTEARPAVCPELAVCPGSAGCQESGACQGAAGCPEPVVCHEPGACAGGTSCTGHAECREVLAVRAFFPSLHLNLAADYLTLRRFEAARRHLDRAWRTVGVLDEGGHGEGVRAALGRLEQRMRESGAGY
ncbi:hypothetical protein OG909_02960 [Streptomyces sp. NBC_01754]|uniref:hypothetical protein n=1 Tax=Streptomyces sp. NBC_01754 TaxID=2975930 RepID=UPI002DD951A4|nr:hypothetical protein [Streptomyces sp. NBC_01754]WSC91342.1 hypothetical protein OG909_02960 [Streptomyces sp. NBC_01754]